MESRIKIKEVLATTPTGQKVTVMGWVRTFRNNQFIALNDGSTINNIQVVVDYENQSQELLKKITTGAAIKAEGQLIESQGKGQAVEIKATDITIYGEADPEKYPLQPKKHSLEFFVRLCFLCEML